MATLSLGNKTLFTQSGSNDPVISSDVNLINADMSNVNIKTSFNSLDTSASQGPTTDLTNTTLPIFACRAWVNFDGSSGIVVGSETQCTIRASGNVSKVIRPGTGIFEIYFDTPMPDINYVMVGSGFYGSGPGTYMGIVGVYNNANYSDSVTTTYIKIAQTGHDGANANCEGTMLAFFR